MTVETSSIYPANLFLVMQFSFDVYVSSQPVQEPAKMTKIIVDALEITGQRGIINKGWGGLGECKSFFSFSHLHFTTSWPLPKYHTLFCLFRLFCIKKFLFCSIVF